MDKNDGVILAKCPLGQYCYPSCYHRMGNWCYFGNKRGRQIPAFYSGLTNRNTSVNLRMEQTTGWNRTS